MRTKTVLIMLVLALLLVPGSLAQDMDKPTVAILRFGPALTATYIEDNLLGGLLRMGFVNQAEFQNLLERQNLKGERINILWGDAQFDFGVAQTLVDSVLDKDVDAIVASSTPVTLAALTATTGLDDAPAIIFGEVYAPYEAGIARSACVKPSNLTGVSPETPYSDILPLLMMQDPQLETIGVLYSLNEASGVVGAETIKQLGDELGLTVLESGVNTVSDLALATEAIIERGAEALIIPSDTITLGGLPILMQSAAEHSIPVFHSVSSAFAAGATVGAGTSQYEWQGLLIASMLAGHLSGDLDIARVGIGAVSELTVGVNLDTAQQQELEISDSLRDRADVVIQDGVVLADFLVERMAELGYEGDALMQVMRQLQQTGTGGLSELPPEVQELTGALRRDQQDMQAALSQYFASVHCTDEMIAQQQAELDAAGE